MIKKYNAIKCFTNTNLRLDETVYEFMGFDYGRAYQDSRLLETPCIAVTREPDGDGPFLVVPLNCLEELSYESNT
jgi:hypothetical protein